MKDFDRRSLGDILTLERRPVNVLPDKSYTEIGMYSFGRGIFHKTPRMGIEVGDKDLFLIKDGDFILQITFAWEGAVGLASINDDGLHGSVRFPTFRVNDYICFPKYLVNYFKTPEGRDQLVKISPGSAGRNRVLSLKRLPEIQVPLPPLEEQHRIVARIEEVAAKIEEARGLRTQTQLETTHLFNSVLHNLFTDNENKWTGVAIDTVAEIIDPNPSHRMPQYSEDGIPFISTIDFDGPETIRKKTAKHVTEDTYQEQKQRCLFAINDILYSRIGTIGEARILTELWPFALSHVLVVVKPKQEVILPRFLLWYLRSDSIVTQAYTATRSIGVPDLGIKRIREFSIPLPTLAEQKKIVMFLDNQQTYITKLKRHQTETSAELNALLPSILDKAFKGEL